MIFNPELQHKLPDIYSLFRTLMEKETGEYVMTLAEKLRSEGEKKGYIEGLKEAIDYV